MTKEQFKIFWSDHYPETLPLSYLLKHYYPERWFRIHSLPRSKRYPGGQEEWEILLNRQNSVITDILGANSKILVVTGDYHYEGYIELHPLEDANSINQFSFTSLDDIDLHKILPEEYEKGQVYKPIFCESVWSMNTYNDVLRDIAQDKLRVIFVSIDGETLVAPYDGGVDFILKDSETRDKYKMKYHYWLPIEDDGL